MDKGKGTIDNAGQQEQRSVAWKFQDFMGSRISLIFYSMCKANINDGTNGNPPASPVSTRNDVFSIIAKDITKTYEKGKVIAIDGVSFNVKKGELFGLIGPDGAGKTSLFRILVTVLLADKGEAAVEGFDVVRAYQEIRNRIGYMPGRSSLYQDLTVEANLNFFASLLGTPSQEH